VFKTEMLMTKKEITQLSYDITGCAIKVHKELVPGLLESVYEKCMKYELEKRSFQVKQQVAVPIIYDNLYLETDLRLDLLVNDCIIVEIKAVEHVLPVHEAPLITYMKILKNRKDYSSTSLRTILRSLSNHS
jgi:GxxExxY protein